MTHQNAASDKPTRRRRDPKGTRDRLVRAALDLFTTQGYHASTTPQIAARAGIAEGTIYRHFESKAHLLNEIYRAGLRLLTTALEEPPEGQSCRERLYQVASEWRSLASHNPPLIKLRRRFQTEIQKVVADGKSRGEVKAGSVELWTEVWLRLVVLVLERTAARDWSLEHPSADQVLDSAWNAIRNPES
jgi:AcrR family transcriptional regulator